MGKVLIYSDFDGTATSRAGEKTVFSTFYQSLLKGYQEGVRQHYATTPMKTADEVHSLFERKFGIYDPRITPGKEDADLLLSPEAVVFFHEVLKNNEVSVNFITKNRADYIQALFRYQGFSEEEISRLNIMDSRNKYNDVKQNIPAQKDVSHIYVLDDSGDDFNKMTRAISDYGHTAEIRGHNEKAGTFQWTQYIAEIKVLTSAERLDMLNKSNFITCLEGLLNKQADLGSRGYRSVAIQLQCLHNDLLSKKNQFLDGTIKDIPTFVKECTNCINLCSKSGDFASHRGFFGKIMHGLMVALETLSMGRIKAPPTDTMVKTNQIKHLLDELHHPENKEHEAPAPNPLTPP